MLLEKKLLVTSFFSFFTFWTNQGKKLLFELFLISSLQMFQIWCNPKLCHLVKTYKKQGAEALTPLPGIPLAL